MGEVIDVAALVISELFTNAITHTGSAEITCAVRVDEAMVRVEVRDQGPNPMQPCVRHAAVEEEHGRGLLIVQSVAERWGVAVDENEPGCAVWAVLRLRPHNRSD